MFGLDAESLLPSSWYWVFATSTTHRCLPQCVPQRFSHYHIKETANIQSKNLCDGNNFPFWLKIRMSGGWAETSFGFYSSSNNNVLKLTVHVNWNYSALQSGTEVTKWHIKDNEPCYFFCQRVFFNMDLVSALEGVEVQIYPSTRDWDEAKGLDPLLF